VASADGWCLLIRPLIEPVVTIRAINATRSGGFRAVRTAQIATAAPRPQSCPAWLWPLVLWRRTPVSGMGAGTGSGGVDPSPRLPCRAAMRGAVEQPHGAV